MDVWAIAVALSIDTSVVSTKELRKTTLKETGRRRTSWLFTSEAEDLNKGLPRAASFRAFGLLSKYFSLDITSPYQYKCWHHFRVLKTLTFKTKPSENTFLVKLGCPLYVNYQEPMGS